MYGTKVCVPSGLRAPEEATSAL